MVAKEFKMLLRGEYGRLPGEVNEDVRKTCIGDDEIITVRPADLLKPEMDEYREEIKGLMEQEEDIVTYAMFPQVAPKFFEYRRAGKYKLDSTIYDKENKIHPV
jgi:oxaloacetate decarboxylase alpha subunit